MVWATFFANSFSEWNSADNSLGYFSVDKKFMVLVCYAIATGAEVIEKDKEAVVILELVVDRQFIEKEVRHV